MATDIPAPEPNLPGLTPERIEVLVHTFYGRVQQHPDLGPVFAARISDWPPHLERMVNFWRTILRGEHLFAPQLRGGPPQLHRAIEELTSKHFDQWLALFEDVCGDVFPPPIAAYVIGKAKVMRGPLARHLEGPRWQIHVQPAP